MKIVYLVEDEVRKLNEARAGAGIRDWIYKRAPKFGPPVHEKMVSYIK